MTAPAPQEGDGRKTDLGGLVAVLRRRAGLILVCAVAAAIAATGISLLQQKQYSASASLLFRNPGFAENLFDNTGGSPTTDPTR